MFAFGTEKGRVSGGKFLLPSAFGLKKKKIYGVWAGEYVLYLSDDLEALRIRSGGDAFEVYIDSRNHLHLPEAYEGCEVRLKGCISTIRLGFDK